MLSEIFIPSQAATVSGTISISLVEISTKMDQSKVLHTAKLNAKERSTVNTSLMIGIS